MQVVAGDKSTEVSFYLWVKLRMAIPDHNCRFNPNWGPVALEIIM